jgi:hypothetical protein
MRVPHGEGLATHAGPESCAVAGNGGGEALTGGHAGRVSSRENTNSRGPRLSPDAEGHTGGAALARRSGLLRGHRPLACRHASCAGTGRAHEWLGGDGPRVRAYLGDRGR